MAGTKAFPPNELADSFAFKPFKLVPNERKFHDAHR